MRIDRLGRLRTLAGRADAIPPGTASTPARRLDVSAPVADLPDGAFLVASEEAHMIWCVGRQGEVRPLAGTGAAGDSGDGGPALRAQIGAPAALLPLPDGSFLFSDRDFARVRRASADGLMTAFAGDGRPQFAGDGGPATAASLNGPAGLALEDDGSVLIADRVDARIRRVDPAGMISTLAGNGEPQDRGDGGPATTAELAFRAAVTRLPSGGYIVGGAGLRAVDGAGVIGTILSPAAHDFAGRRMGLVLGAQFLPDGSLVAASDHAIVMLASGDAERLAVALRGLTVSSRRVGARIDATRGWSCHAPSSPRTARGCAACVLARCGCDGGNADG